MEELELVACVFTSAVVAPEATGGQAPVSPSKKTVERCRTSDSSPEILHPSPFATSDPGPETRLHV